METTTLAGRLAALRGASGLSARGLARAADIALAAVGLLERGDVLDPRTDTVVALARVLGCSVGYLAAGEGDPPTRAQIRAAARAAMEARGLDPSDVADDVPADGPVVDRSAEYAQDDPGAALATPHLPHPEAA